MRCNVCGTEVAEEQKCSVCGFTPIDFETLPDSFKTIYNNMIVNARTMNLKDVRVFLRIYYWKKVNDQFKEKKQEKILIHDDLGSLDPENVNWCDMEFAKQTAGEIKQLSVLVETGGKEKSYTANVIAPATEGTWKVGLVLKPGFRFVLRVGDEMNYSDTNLLSLKD